MAKAKCSCGCKIGTRRTKKLLRNNVALVLDDSGSMGSIARTAEGVFNSWLARMKAEAISKGQETNISIITFGQKIDVKSAHQPSAHVRPIAHYYPRQGRTALFEGVDKSIDVLSEAVELRQYDDSYLVLVVTDGEENMATTSYINKVVRRIKNKQGEGNWTFVFMLPPGSRIHFCSKNGIPTDNAIEWEQSERGVREVEVHTSTGLTNYYDSRAKGSRSVANFFVQPDLSKVKSTDIKRKLDDVTRYCHQFEVIKEEVIKDFVEKKTKYPYVIGTAYYQLMKPEKVQATKDVLIIEKGKPQIWGGPSARTMIGLPANQDAKVDPYNLSKYEVYIKSTSVNRKLPRGTKVIVVDHIPIY